MRRRFRCRACTAAARVHRFFQYLDAEPAARPLPAAGPDGPSPRRRPAGTAQAALRDGRDRLARSGGEEFVVLLAGADPDTALSVAERMRAAVAELGIPHESTEHGCLGISLGVVSTHTGELFDSVLQVADEALYRAKSAGRNRASA